MRSLSPTPQSELEEPSLDSMLGDVGSLALQPIRTPAGVSEARSRFGQDKSAGTPANVGEAEIAEDEHQAEAIDDVPPVANRSVQEQLEAEVCIPMRTPLIKGGPRLRRSRTPVSIPSLRRSVRQVARPREPNAVRQAQNVLLKKLGIHVDEGAVEADIEDKLKALFRGDMSDRKKQCLEVLLNGNIDLSAMDLDTAGLEEAGL